MIEVGENFYEFIKKNYRKDDIIPLIWNRLNEFRVEKEKINFVDSNHNTGKVSYIPINRLKYFESGFEQELRQKYEVERRPGRFLKTIMPELNQSDVDNFVQMHHLFCEEQRADFEIVSGKDIVKYYYVESYDRDCKGTLGNSCMRYSHCKQYTSYYSDISNCKMLILKNRSGKIKGRALIWENVYVYKLKKRITFMDRIYVNNFNDQILFTEYASKMGWGRKAHQDFETPKLITYKGEAIKTRMSVKLDDKSWGREYYPYCDTFDNVAIKILKKRTRDKEVRAYNYVPKLMPSINLRNIEGGYSDNYYWSKIENRWIYRNNAHYLEYASDWCSVGNVIQALQEVDRVVGAHISHCVQSKYHSAYVLKDCAVYIKDEDDYFLKSIVTKVDGVYKLKSKNNSEDAKSIFGIDLHDRECAFNVEPMFDDDDHEDHLDMMHEDDTLPEADGDTVQDNMLQTYSANEILRARNEYISEMMSRHLPQYPTLINSADTNDADNND